MNGTRTKLCGRASEGDLGVSVASKGEGDDEGGVQEVGQDNQCVILLGCLFLVLPKCGEGTGFCFRA